MREPTYRIKPLRWEETRHGVRCKLAFCEYGIWFNEERGTYDLGFAGLDNGPKPRNFDTLDEAKAAAEAHWRSRLASVLQRVDTEAGTTD